MEENIINRVAGSGILTLNLEEYRHPGPRIELDIKDTLFMGQILREKDFRDWIKNHDWEQYRDANVAIFCSADAIIPTWAYMLIASRLTGIAHHFVFGNTATLETSLFQKALSAIHPEDFQDKRVVIKGCGDLPVPESAYVEASRLLLPVVKTLMFGEPCSTVPVFKRAD
ncbi:MAG: DUF2480 family protein [Bacteroidetes bacterium]|nr:DUF2480 family protein [Bacteroidota bacterium]